MRPDGVAQRGHLVDILFTIALFCVFATTALMVVVIGAGVYQNTVSGMSENFNTRTTISYVSTKIRQNDTQGAVYLDQMEGSDALVLEQNFDGQVYQTWIYCYDGMLRELFVEKGNTMPAESGQGILHVQDFSVEWAGEGLLSIVSVDEEGVRSELMISPRSVAA